MSAQRRTGSSLLECEDLSLSFAGVKALRDVHFTVQRGEICAIVGPNGAGKSSLLNVISGVYRPQRGNITFAGLPLALGRPFDAARRGIGRTFQHLALFRGMSVLDNVIAGRSSSARASFVEQAFRVGRAPADARRQREEAERVIEWLGLQRYRDRFVSTLPYGLQKRVDLARALVSDPVLLLLDEPMAGMTFAEKDEMCRFITDANDDLGVTVVLIEHDLGVVMDLSDHVVVLDHGALIGDGKPADIREDPRVIDAYLGVPSKGELAL